MRQRKLSQCLAAFCLSASPQKENGHVIDTRDRLFHSLGAHHLGMKIKFQLRCGFSARWRISPVLQRFLD